MSVERVDYYSEQEYQDALESQGMQEKELADMAMREQQEEYRNAQRDDYIKHCESRIALLDEQNKVMREALKFIRASSLPEWGCFKEANIALAKVDELSRNAGNG